MLVHSVASRIVLDCHGTVSMLEGGVQEEVLALLSDSQSAERSQQLVSSGAAQPGDERL